MNISKYSIGAVAIASVLVAAPAFALMVNAGASADVQLGSTTVGASAQAKVSARVADGINRADQEITRRTTALTDLDSKVQAMVRVSATEKAAIDTEANSEITTLNTLKAKIDADTDIATLKTDIKSITQDYRIFMLIVPQGRIEVAADKIQTVTANYMTFAGKLQGRINAGQAAGKDVTSATASLTDMNAKIADANVQATAAISHVSGLQPDQGNQTTMQANQAAIKLARADIKIALTDLKTARQDAGAIVKIIQSWHLDASASSTVGAQ